MFQYLSTGNPVYLPSRFWDTLNKKNLEHLESDDGYENFKQTIARNYFTFFVWPGNNQFRYLLRKTKSSAWLSILKGLFASDPSPQLHRLQKISLTIFTRMLWQYVESIDVQGLLKSLEEPQEGNPFKICQEGRLISQDLANSVLEYYSIREHFNPSEYGLTRICELGAGYGRNAYVFMQAFPNCKYIIIDIPPALYIAQRYLSSVFKHKKIFTFRPFENYSEVHEELQLSDLAFLLPHQAELLPQKTVDLFVNISSLHEMRMDQIRAYFSLIDRLTKGYFYMKQWFVSRNPYDRIIIKHTDYPVPGNWKKVYLRKARVQGSFFEAMYEINSF
ncbi:MAG: putative sugar O-methyltransferase [Deltaproteobacteria bacterium]|nr:putative sugar O-methyltransferase [Deltaproteobacteria bacterium]MBW2114148.1 putative sugar O-methyltransferase [Deltaproteobacteria bacterium]MBW2357225.1 putative sugar O-methyltransferase [Deltaproteobacteria bacterium]